jgi:hypothetical protein
MLFNLEKFSTTYFAPVLIIFGLFGNLFGLIVVSKKKLVKIGPQIIYIALFLFDSINFVLIFQSYLTSQFNIDITVFSSFACKTYWYINFAFGPISPMLNIYISIERYISIAYSTKKYFLIKKQIQLAYIIAVSLYNLLLYVPLDIYNDLIVIESNQSNQTTCNMDSYWNYMYNVIDLTNRVIIPFMLMTIFSILITYTIFTSRSRVSSNSRSNRTFRKDIRFSLIIILLNISFIVWCSPVTLLIFVSDYWFIYLFNFFNYLYFMSYCSNFYLMFLVNSLFRGAFYSIFVPTNKTKRPNNKNKQVIIAKNNTKTRKNTTGINAETRENKSKE